MKDYLVKATACDGHVRIICVRTTDLVETTREKHDMWPTSLAALGRVEAMGAIMGSMLKDEKEKVVLQINGGGPIGTVLVEAKNNGDVRGFVGDPHQYLKYNDSNKLAVGPVVGNQGYLSVTKDLHLKDNFTGKVQLQTGEIGDDFAYYFTLSEQTPSAVSVGVLVGTDAKCQAAGGLLIQMMPNAVEEDIQYVENVVGMMKPISTYMDEGKSPEEVVKMLFPEAVILETSPVQFKCDCSKDRFKAALTTLKMEDLMDMKENNHGCEVRCDYCNSYYQFTEEELDFIMEFKKSCSL
ncbi:MAG: Hsp33 family molecular chaperone HslO [Erysipelotrichaceae bacterium]|nr:Hsp33 family molecular chaperone HslO [Erysipelotrichaceae bacterium]